MGFMEVWASDPEQIVSADKLSEHAIAHEGIFCNIDEDDAFEIPADTATQLREVWRLFDLEQRL
jgi:hypothetical protein